MIQIVFTDNGKVHTVTFSGEDTQYWASRFKGMLSNMAIIWEERNI